MEAGGGGRNTTRFEISSDEISTIDEVHRSKLLTHGATSVDHHPKNNNIHFGFVPLRHWCLRIIIDELQISCQH